MNPKATIVSLTNLSHSRPAPSFPHTFSFSTILRLQKEKTRAVRKAC